MKIFATVPDPTMPKSMRFPVFCIALYPLLTAGFFVVGYFDRHGLYKRLLAEDGPVEWVTAAMMMLVGVIALGLARRLKQRGDYNGWAVAAALIFAAACFLAGMEEVSYGQRLFGWESPEFFLEHSTQPETNLHNLIQALLRDHGSPIYKTRHFLALGMGAYGLALPVLLRLVGRRPGRDTQWGMIVPPLFLATGFILGCHMTLFDWPTRYEEEIGEAYLASCILIVAGRAWLRLVPRGGTSGVVADRVVQGGG